MGEMGGLVQSPYGPERQTYFEEKLEAHLLAKPQYPLYGEVSLEEHVKWEKAYSKWDSEKTRLEMLLSNAKPKEYINFNSVENGYNPHLSRPKGISGKPEKARWAKITPKDEAHARKLASQAKYREKCKLVKKAQDG